MSAAVTGAPEGLAVGLYLPLCNGALPQHLDVALEAEDLGFARLWVRDLLFAEETPSGENGALRDQRFEAATYLSALAAVTSTIGLGSAVFTAPTRHPILLAKQAASIDVMSMGRFVLGLGTGYPTLYEAFGLSYDERMDRLLEGVELMRAAWSGRPLTGRSRFGHLTGQRVLPEPFTSGGPPVLLASSAVPSQGQLAWFDGWMRNRRSLSTDKADLGAFAKVTADAGRPCRSVIDFAVALGQPAGVPVETVHHGNVLVCEPHELVAALRVYSAMGATEVLLAFVGEVPAHEQMRTVATEVLPAVQPSAAH